LLNNYCPSCVHLKCHNCTVEEIAVTPRSTRGVKAKGNGLSHWAHPDTELVHTAFPDNAALLPATHRASLSDAASSSTWPHSQLPLNCLATSVSTPQAGLSQYSASRSLIRHEATGESPQCHFDFGGPAAVLDQYQDLTSSRLSPFQPSD
jgi:hypothetical protein